MPHRSERSRRPSKRGRGGPMQAPGAGGRRERHTLGAASPASAAPGTRGAGLHVTLRDDAASRWRRTWRCGVGPPCAPSGSGPREVSGPGPACLGVSGS